eukprot:768491-Hanusia_phi.AAC.3
MEDPVFAADGFIYDRKYIECWLNEHQVSPMSNQPLLKDGSVDVSLRKNAPLKMAIDDWEAKRQQELQFGAIPSKDIHLNTTRPKKQLNGLTLQEREANPDLENFSEDDLRLAQIGLGQDKTVYRGWWSSRDVAIVRFRSGSIDAESSAMLRLRRHPHLITLYGYTTDASGSKYLIEELAPLGSMDVVVEGVAPALRQDEACRQSIFMEVLHQVTSGMHGVVEAGLLHRDLSLRNILVVNLNVSERKVLVKVADFGTSQTMSVMHNDQSIPCRWTAPEVLRNRRKASEKSDVYSFGVLVWELLSFGENMPYWEVQEDSRVIEDVAKGKLCLEKPFEADEVVWDVASMCLQFDPISRPSFLELLLHFRGVKSKLFPTIANAPPTQSLKPKDIAREILNQAEMDAQQLIDQARAEANQLRQMAEEEASRILCEAQTKLQEAEKRFTEKEKQLGSDQKNELVIKGLTEQFENACKERDIWKSHARDIEKELDAAKIALSDANRVQNEETSRQLNVLKASWNLNEERNAMLEALAQAASVQLVTICLKSQLSTFPQPTGTFGYVVANPEAPEQKPADPRVKAGVGIIFKTVQLPDGRQPLMVKNLSADGPAKLSGKIEVTAAPASSVLVRPTYPPPGRRYPTGGGWKEMKMCCSPKGSPVQLKLERAGKTFHVIMSRGNAASLGAQ